MLTRRARSGGFTLVELMIAVVVMAILITVAMPSFQTWIRNTQIRNAGDALLNGLQLARIEALRRNKNVEFAVGNTSGWTVTQATPQTLIQTHVSTEGGANQVTVDKQPGDAQTVTFSALGGVTPNGDGSSSLTRMNIYDPSAGPGTRKLAVLIPASGSIRMCDYTGDLQSTDARACP